MSLQIGQRLGSQVIEKALEKDPANRPPMRDMVAALRQIARQAHSPVEVSHSMKGDCSRVLYLTRNSFRSRHATTSCFPSIRLSTCSLRHCASSLPLSNQYE